MKADGSGAIGSAEATIAILNRLTGTPGAANPTRCPANHFQPSSEARHALAFDFSLSTTT
jgi:hypothetical protein